MWGFSGRRAGLLLESRAQAEEPRKREEKMRGDWEEVGIAPFFGSATLVHETRKESLVRMSLLSSDDWEFCPTSLLYHGTRNGNWRKDYMQPGT